MQPPQNQEFAPPPPVYSLPPRAAGFPLWGKIFIGCGVLLAVLFVLIGVGVGRLASRLRGPLQTQFCFQNLRASQRGLELYSQDYDQTLPQATVWMDATTPYVNGQTDFYCPVVRAANPRGFGYAFNSPLSGLTTAKIDLPTTTALVYDSSNILRNATDAVTTLPSPSRHVRRPNRSTPNAPRNGNLIGYADGHVRFVGPDGTSSEISNSPIRKTLFSQPKKTK